ncbi:Beige 1 [Podosphaera aphanis]|nr:Beige 1 [Podosphaera aphanis]
MSKIDSRPRSSTTSSQQLEFSNSTRELQLLLEDLAARLEPPSEGRYPDLGTLITTVELIHHYLVAFPNSVRANDDFRYLHGFQVLLDTLRAYSGFYHPTDRTLGEKNQLFVLLGMILKLLSRTIMDHNGNQRFFRQRVEQGGWAALEQNIASIGIGGSESDSWSELKLFGELLSFSFNDQRFNSFCQNVIELYQLETTRKGTPEEELPTTPSSDEEFTRLINTCTQKWLSEILTEGVQLCHADMIPTIIDFWKTIPRTTKPAHPSTLIVIKTLTKVASLSSYNLKALHSTGILTTLLSLAFDVESPLGPVERDHVEVLCTRLISIGVNSLNDTQYLLCNKSSSAAEFFLRAMKSSHGPPHIQFDLSLNGYASIELPNLGKSFPPSSNMPGYTFMAWIHVENFDKNVHTTIFGAFDPSQTCFVLAYLEMDTHNLILQTSVTSSRPSVRFKSFVFAENRWYHISIVHKRQRTMISSKSSLFVNGEFVEQVKCQYPAQPPLSNPNVDGFASFTSPARTNPVQVFLGTPKDLSTLLGRNRVFSRWSLASAHLFGDTLSDDLIAVYYRLGPRYNGNFQDCLGSFQTYEASAALGMRNELIHPSKNDSSEILGAIREKASTLLPESRVLFGIFPTSIFGDDAGHKTHGSQVLRYLDRIPLRNLTQLTHNYSALVAINAAVPSINEALTRVHGTTILTGNPVVIVPRSLDNTLWQIGGFTSIALKLVEASDNSPGILRSVEILFEGIKSNWRNSEAMEKDNGYAILAALIRGKIGAGTVVSCKSGPDNSSLTTEERDQLGFRLLSLILDFVGYNHERPEESYIINPLAYRILLVDFDMWRKTTTITQMLYYKQFITFGVKSKYHQFNSRRLFRMRIVKRFLDALKAETFSEDVFPSFIDALTSLIRCNVTAEVFRSLALFITYAYHRPSNSNSRVTRTTTGKLKRPTLIDGREDKINILTRRQCGTKVLEMYSSLLCEKGNTSIIWKFARTVTNKWLLHLLAEDDAEVIVLATKILARLVVVHGSSYITKFSNKTGGFIIMRHRLKRWWGLPMLWAICLSILFNKDVAEIDLERPFELFSVWETFCNCKVINAQVLPVLTSMLQHGLREVLRNQDDPITPVKIHDNQETSKTMLVIPTISSTRQRSISLTTELEFRQRNRSHKNHPDTQADILHTVTRFFADLHGKSSDFRDFALSSEYVRLLLAVLFPVVVGTDAVRADIELNSQDSALTFEGDDVIIRPVSRLSHAPELNMTISSVNSHLSTSTSTKSLRRRSSFILLTSQPSEFNPSSAKLTLVTSLKKENTIQQVSNSLIEGLLELVICIFIDRVMARKEFPGFGIFSKTPPGFQEHQVYFQTYILRNTISQLANSIQLDQKSLWEPKIIQNMARVVTHICEAVFEGWFLSGSEPLIDFAGTLLEYFQRPEISKIKSVRLCQQAILVIKSVFLRVVLLRLSELDSSHVSESEAVTFMDKLSYWQAVLLSPEPSQDDFLKLVCYQLYLKLVDSRESVRLSAANLWRIMLVQKPEETSTLFQNAMSHEHRNLTIGFKKLIELDNHIFVRWVDEQRIELDALFFGAMSKTWEKFVSTENQKTEETNKSRVSRRKEKLRQWYSEELTEEDILLRHGQATMVWTKNIYASEHLKNQRTQQDQQDNFTFLASIFSNMDRELNRPCAVFHNNAPTRWKLDRTEGRNRMRLRMMPDRASPTYDYRPKRRTTGTTQNPLSDLRSQVTSTSSTGSAFSSSTLTGRLNLDGNDDSAESISTIKLESGDNQPDSVSPEDDFELVDDPNDPGEDSTYEDKNRKVMRSLQRGDQVQYVFNISRIIGLEACEGLCIIGKDCLYLIDNVFQRSDGEIVNVFQAPKEERDPYLQMISGKKEQKDSTEGKCDSRVDQMARNWKWSDLISISKRRFLFRDVAVEIFFTDGRSYLLTAISPVLRDDLHTKITSKAPHTCGNSSLPNPEDGWRLEALKVSEEAPTSLSHKFGSIFNSSAWNPAMRKWAKGEISNFHYLMLVNTMAGRTFNDLTQYPVFPWVLSDYTSTELDLDNPASFRDLSKPMGAQHSSRAAEFIERYKQFAEMSDHNTPAFHYGTHYSSAMIVTSYLIRLQPFVQSYLLLQGGNFDHPDRLFYSIEKAWLSASRDNMTDVRELIPEFFYLPEFLTNSNGFNFGMRQGKGGAIDTVELPPWAKGDPKIFIAKNREALESPYVSRHLHQWIDLIFGSKQRGEAAIDSVNVFHHLSYHGARDLETISDPMQKLATIGIIHNFGQTPHQIFSKPHQSREDIRNKPKRLDTSAHTLTRLPFPLLEYHDRVASIIYLSKLDRLLCTTSLRLYLPPHYEKYLEYGFADGSLRFFFVDSKKPAGLFENIHQGQVTSAVFASSTLLITSGEDCVVSAHDISISQGKIVNLDPRASLFGHKTPVTVLAVSKSFSTLLSASTDGVVILWDLNRLEFVRRLTTARGTISCACINDVTGDIMLCRGQRVTLYTLNGDFILEQNVGDSQEDYIASCAWYEGTGNEWIENEICFTGQRGGIANCWKKVVAKNTMKWALKLVKRMQHYSDVNRCGETAVGSLGVGSFSLSNNKRSRSYSSLNGKNDAAITCIRPIAQTVYTGDDEGRVYEWDLVQREG